MLLILESQGSLKFISNPENISDGGKISTLTCLNEGNGLDNIKMSAPGSTVTVSAGETWGKHHISLSQRT